MVIEKGIGRLRRDIGLLGVGFLVLNGLIGAGIFALPAAIFAKAGLFSPWLFPIIGLLFITIILSFGELASYFQESGGPVLYNNTAFGPLVGFQTGWVLYIARMTAMAANVNVLIYYGAFLFPIIAEGVGRVITLFVVFAALAISNILGVKGAVRVLGVLSSLKLLPLLLLILLGLPHVVPDALLPTQMPQIDDLGSTALLLMYAFMGFESALVTAGETSNPRKNIPKALIITVLGITVFYFLVQLVYVSINPAITTQGAPLVELGKVLMGASGAIIITLAAVFSVGGNLMANMIAVPRMTYAMAEEKTLPQWFQKLHATHDTPVNSIIFYTVLCFIFAVSGSFVWLAVVSSVARLMVFVLCLLALPVLRKKLDPETLAQANRLPGGYIIPLIAMALCVWAASYSHLDTWLALGGLIGVGFGLYAITKQGQ